MPFVLHVNRHKYQNYGSKDSDYQKIMALYIFNTQLVKSVARFYILRDHSTTLVWTGIAILQLHNIAARQGATNVIQQHEHFTTLHLRKALIGSSW